MFATELSASCNLYTALDYFNVYFKLKFNEFLSEYNSFKSLSTSLFQDHGQLCTQHF